jgi:hypothetical protein
VAATLGLRHNGVELFAHHVVMPVVMHSTPMSLLLAQDWGL